MLEQDNRQLRELLTEALAQEAAMREQLKQVQLELKTLQRGPAPSMEVSLQGEIEMLARQLHRAARTIGDLGLCTRSILGTGSGTGSAFDAVAEETELAALRADALCGQ